MAAPMASRRICVLARRLLNCKHSGNLLTPARCMSKNNKLANYEIDPDHYNDNTVPYLPEEEAKRSIEAEYPDIEVSKEEFKFVERLLPQKTVPPMKEHEHYPTPSGWLPPFYDKQPMEYGVRRTRNHMLPCYFETRSDGQQTVKVKHIYGDIWKFRDDAVEFLQNEVGKTVDTQVHEIGRFVRFRGNHHEKVAEFLLKHGF